MIEYTLCLIKPDALDMGNMGSIITDIERVFEIHSLRMLHVKPKYMEKFYAEHKGKTFYPGLIDFMCSGPLVAIVLGGRNVVSRWRNFIGDTDPKEAAPNTLRAQYGLGVPNNALHGSDSTESALREIKIFFPGF